MADHSYQNGDNQHPYGGRNERQTNQAMAQARLEGGGRTGETYINGYGYKYDDGTRPSPASSFEIPAEINKPSSFPDSHTNPPPPTSDSHNPTKTQFNTNPNNQHVKLKLNGKEHYPQPQHIHSNQQHNFQPHHPPLPGSHPSTRPASPGTTGTATNPPSRAHSSLGQNIALAKQQPHHQEMSKEEAKEALERRKRRQNGMGEEELDGLELPPSGEGAALADLDTAVLYNEKEARNLKISGFLVQAMFHAMCSPLYICPFPSRKRLTIDTGPTGMCDLLVWIPTPKSRKRERWMRDKQRMERAAMSNSNLSDMSDWGNEGQGKKRGVVLSVHGGGWTICRPDVDYKLCRYLADELGTVVVAPNYRKAPKYPFPNALYQMYAVLCWLARGGLQKHISAYPFLNLDYQNLALVGNSSGSNICAALSLLCVRRPLPNGAKIAAEGLLYPVLDLAVPHSDKMDRIEGPYEGVPPWMSRMFLKGFAPPPRDRKDPLMSPAHAPVHELAKYPPTVLLTAEYDYLCYEADVFAEQLREAGVRVAHKRFARVGHAFDAKPNMPWAKEQGLINSVAREEAWAMIQTMLWGAIVLHRDEVVDEALAEGAGESEAITEDGAYLSTLKRTESKREAIRRTIVETRVSRNTSLDDTRRRNSVSLARAASLPQSRNTKGASWSHGIRGSSSAEGGEPPNSAMSWLRPNRSIKDRNGLQSPREEGEPTPSVAPSSSSEFGVTKRVRRPNWRASDGGQWSGRASHLRARSQSQGNVNQYNPTSPNPTAASHEVTRDPSEEVLQMVPRTSDQDVRPGQYQADLVSPESTPGSQGGALIEDANQSRVELVKPRRSG